MKTINNYINEKLHITSKQQYSCQPTAKNELREIIIQRIEEDGPDCYLNDIDVSKINDMSHLFDAGNWAYGNKIFKDFNGDLSKWNVSNVTNMWCMFYGCKKFNCDISRWDVSKVEDMDRMFKGCEQFNCNISKWNTSSVKDMFEMFKNCKNFNCDLSDWNVSKVEYIEYMKDAFKNCPTKPKWYKGK